MSILIFLLGIVGIGISVFGGGPVFIPIFETFYVTAIFTEAQFTSITSLITAFPGPVAAKYILVGGYEEFNVLIAFIGLFVFTLIPVIMIVSMYRALKYLKRHLIIARTIRSIAAVTVGILSIIGIRFIGIGTTSQYEVRSLGIFLVAFLLIHFIKVNKTVLLITSIAISILVYYV